MKNEYHFSPAAERNKYVIFQQLSNYLNGNESVLEIGSAGGEHALFFVDNWPNLHWQCSDRQEYILSLSDNLKQSSLKQPILLDVTDYDWSTSKRYNAVYTANTLHIMNEQQVAYFLQHVTQAVHNQGYFFIYGPFKYQNQYIGDSNQQFDQYIQHKYPGAKIKDFETVQITLEKAGFSLVKDVCMPANNQLLVWQKTNQPD